MVRAHSLVSLSLLQFLVQFPSCWAMFISSFSSITCNYPLLVMLFVCLFFKKFSYNGTSGKSSSSSSSGFFLEPPFLQPSLITFLFWSLTFWVVELPHLIHPFPVIHPFPSSWTFFLACPLACRIGICPVCAPLFWIKPL